MTKTNFEKYIENKLKKNPVLEEKFHKAEIALDIANQILELRQKKGLTQAELAKSISVSQSNIARLENAEYSGYSLRTLQKIAKALDSNLNIILTTPEQTSSVHNSLYNSSPTTTQFKSAYTKINVTYWGSISTSELINTSSQFELTDFDLSIKPEFSNNGYKFLTI